MITRAAFALAGLLAIGVATLPTAALAQHGSEPATHAGTVSHGAHDPVDAAHGSDAHADDAHAEGGHGVPMLPWIVNFIIFAGALALILRKPITAFFAGRRANIEASLAAADHSQREAATRLAEMETRLSALDSQVAEILERAGQQALAEKEIILASARDEATRILAQAEAQVADLESSSVRRLRSTAAALSVQMARELIEKQIAPEDRQRIFDRTLKSLQKSAS